MVYRELGLKDKMKEITLEEAYTLLSENGMLVKRPLATNGDIVTVGFKVEEFEKYL